MIFQCSLASLPIVVISNTDNDAGDGDDEYDEDDNGDDMYVLKCLETNMQSKKKIGLCKLPTYGLIRQGTTPDRKFLFSISRQHCRKG